MKSYSVYDKNGNFKKGILEFKKEEDFLIFRLIMQEAETQQRDRLKYIENNINFYKSMKKCRDLSQEEEEYLSIITQEYENLNNILRFIDFQTVDIVRD